jgi:hypothetical protein
LQVGIPLAGDAGILVHVPQPPHPKGIPPVLPAMLSRIGDYVAALAERPQVSRSAVSRIMIKVRARQHDIAIRTLANAKLPFNETDLPWLDFWGAGHGKVYDNLEGMVFRQWNNDRNFGTTSPKPEGSLPAGIARYCADSRDPANGRSVRNPTFKVTLWNDRFAPSSCHNG